MKSDVISSEDMAREARIDEAFRLMFAAEDSQTARQYSKKLGDEIASRSPQQVARMEREMGLR